MYIEGELKAEGNKVNNGLMLLKGETEINAKTEIIDNEVGGEGIFDSRKKGKIVINKEVKISNNTVSSGEVFKMEKDLWINSKVEVTNN